MSDLLSNCKKHFDSDNLYDVLGVKRDATKQEIKKGYHKRSLVFHPDRASHDKLVATQKFQILGQVYSILSEDSKREEYDQTGNIDEAFVEQDKSWEQYWRLLFPKITLKDIEQFSEKYRGSEEELHDLKNIYVTSQGDMDKIMGNMLCSTLEDEARYSAILEKMIEDGSVPEFQAFTKESEKKKDRRNRKAKKEAEEAEIEAKKLNLDRSEDSLVAAIRSSSRLKQSENFLTQLEAKYSQRTAKSESSKAKNKSTDGTRRKRKS